MLFTMFALCINAPTLVDVKVLKLVYDPWSMGLYFVKMTHIPIEPFKHIGYKYYLVVFVLSILLLNITLSLKLSKFCLSFHL